MSKRKPDPPLVLVRTDVLNNEHLDELLRSNDPMTRDMAQFVLKYALDDDRVLRRLHDIHKYIWTSSKERGKPGRPEEWGNSGDYYAWLAIECEYQRALKRGPKISFSQAIDDKFKRLKGKPWCIVWDSTDSEWHLLLNTASTARKCHARGRKLIDSDPVLAAVTKHRLEFLGLDPVLAFRPLRRNTRPKTR
jgi:hypothetical protein